MQDRLSKKTVQAVVTGQMYPYLEHKIPKRKGGFRALHTPCPELLEEQRRILSRLTIALGPTVHPASFAYRAGYSVVDCASVHLRAHSVIRLDIADFFGSIRERQVYQVLREFHSSRRAAYEQTRLVTVSPPDSPAWVNRGTGTHFVGEVGQPRKHWQESERWYTYTNTREGFLPQGAPTSGLLSNLVMRDFDQAIYKYASANGLRYTRYADDLHFSRRRTVLHGEVDLLIATVRRELARLGMRLNAEKTRVSNRGAQRSVLGVLVDGPVPRLQREYKRRITKHVRGAATFGIEHHTRHHGFQDVSELDSHVTGLLSFAHMVEPAWAREQLDTWKRLRTLPAVERKQSRDESAVPLDISEARRSIAALVADGQRYRASLDYARLLEFIGRFKQYSPFNAMLVNLQRPGSRYVLTEAKWRVNHRRVLKPGAQPLIIFQPRGPFMLVYDVGTTEALPGALPLPPRIIDPVAINARISNAEAQRRLDWTKNNLAPLGIRLTDTDHANSACGCTYRSQASGTVTRPAGDPKIPEESFPLQFEIEVNKNLEPLDRYATLVHELAHLFCGHLGEHPHTPWPDRPSGTKARDEVEAESIVHMVLSRLDPNVKMGDYIMGFVARHEDIPEVAMDVILKAAGTIIEMADGRMHTSRLRTERGT